MRQHPDEAISSEVRGDCFAPVSALSVSTIGARNDGAVFVFWYNLCP